VHKANDDHTSIYFNSPLFLYSGFTAQFDISNPALLSNSNEENSCENHPEIPKKDTAQKSVSAN
jgi:hypothetical protein